MTRHDEVFALFVAADPVPDSDLDDVIVPDPAPLLRAAEPSGSKQPLWPAEPGRGRWVVAAAAFIVVVLAIGVSVILFDDPSGPVAPSSTSTVAPSSTAVTTTTAGPTTSTVAPDVLDQVATDAVSAAEQFLALLNAGDIDGVMALSTPDASAIPNRRVHEFTAAFAAAGMPVDVGECVPESVTESSAVVRCDVTLGDVVAVELGPDVVVYPFRYQDGLLAWQAFDGIDIGEVNRAYADYLRAYLPEEYAASCSPGAYDPLTIVQSNLLAITGECGELAASAAGDVVIWIREGRPDPVE